MPGRSFTSDNYRYGYQGQEKDDEVSGTGNHNTALFWEYDTRLARRWNLDPKPNPELSHYSVFAANPIMYKDPLGDTIYSFGKDGFFEGVIDDGSKYIIGRFNKSADEIIDFTFNDIDDDRSFIKNRSFRVKLITSDNINKALAESRVLSHEAQKSPWTYIERESRPKGDESYLSGESSGKLDFYENSSQVEKFTLNIVKGKCGTKAYNDYDFGNYLWGAAGKKLGFDLETLKNGAHLNNILSKDGEGFLDSAGDQQAISDGYRDN